MTNRPSIDLLARVFRKYLQIQAVYLFGSTATGKVRVDSDIDLPIVTGDETVKDEKLLILADLAREGFCNVDLVFMDIDDIVLQYEAVRQNVVIYQKPEFDRGSTYSQIVRRYLDFYPYLTVQRKAYKKRIMHGEA
jgi:predicted nucleotidyltransferase